MKAFPSCFEHAELISAYLYCTVTSHNFLVAFSVKFEVGFTKHIKHAELSEKYGTTLHKTAVCCLQTNCNYEIQMQ